MKKQELHQKLQGAYQEMVENIETLIKKEGKTLKEAVETSEEKLSNWKELTKEEAQKVSNEVKSDLQSLGETLNGAKDAYKEQFKQDASYLTESIWEKLRNIVDVSSEQFMSFAEEIKERAHKVRMDDHANEHKDHLRWYSDHELWLDEIELWKNDHQHALDKLQAIEAVITKHTDALNEHAQVIRSHEELDHKHEKVMQGAELDPTSRVMEREDDEEVNIHNQERQEHAQHAELHDYMKKGHREMMALVNNLYKQVVDKSR